MLAVAQKRMPSTYVSLADTHPACMPANDPLYPHAHHHAPARAPGSTLYEEFHPFGTTSYAANDSGIEVSAKRYRYIGKERDEETGLYHCGARYLAAWLGRWTAADPIGLGDGVNRYAYARGNPVALVDQTGTRGTLSDLARKAAAGAVGGTAGTAAGPSGTAEADQAEEELPEFHSEGVTDEEFEREGTEVGEPVPEVKAYPGARYNKSREEWNRAATHIGLDIVGVVPGPVGFAADVINAGLYASEGDWVNAALSGASALGGDLVKGGKAAEGLTSGGIHFSSGGAKISTRAARTQTVGVPTGKEAPVQGRETPFFKPEQGHDPKTGHFLRRGEGEVGPGKPFEDEVEAVIRQIADPGSVAKQPRIKVEGSTKGQPLIPDFGFRFGGRLRLIDAKRSATARVNQPHKQAKLREAGGEVVGSGQPALPAGRPVDPTRVSVIRPEHLERLFRLRAAKLRLK